MRREVVHRHELVGSEAEGQLHELRNGIELVAEAARFARVRSASPISMRFTAAEDRRSSNRAQGRPVASETARAQSLAAWAAGPMVPSIDSGRPTTRPAAPSLRAMAAISAALAAIFPRLMAP